MQNNETLATKLMHLQKELNETLATELMHLQKELNETRIALRYAEGLIAATLNEEAVSDNSLFAHLVPIIMHFAPDGKISPYLFTTRQVIFKTFLSLLRDPEVFSFDSPDDCFWARRQGYMDYLETVRRENSMEETKDA